MPWASGVLRGSGRLAACRGGIKSSKSALMHNEISELDCMRFVNRKSARCQTIPKPTRRQSSRILLASEKESPPNCGANWGSIRERGASWTAAGSEAPRRFRTHEDFCWFVGRAHVRKHRRRCALLAQSKMLARRITSPAHAERCEARWDSAACRRMPRQRSRRKAGYFAGCKVSERRFMGCQPSTTGCTVSVTVPAARSRLPSKSVRSNLT